MPVMLGTAPPCLLDDRQTRVESVGSVSLLSLNHVGNRHHRRYDSHPGLDLKAEAGPIQVLPPLKSTNRPDQGRKVPLA
jgi:hypothetical protein